jgi:D-alanyl-D-alanine carboxypeptidase
MENTTYRNASGLPNDEQITTAHDLAILARSLEDRFPRYFKYFSTESFAYGGETIGNHNHLLGRIDGVDGIKTGYTRASGFNLLTSVHRDGRSLVAVVMGGRSAGQRDRTMAALIEDHLAQGSTVRTGTMVADASAPEDAAPATVEAERAPARPIPVAANVPIRPAAKIADADGEGDNAGDDAQPTLKVAALHTTATPAAAAPTRFAAAPADAAAQPEPQRRTRQANASSPTPPARPKAVADVAAPTKASGTTVAARSNEASDAAATGEDADSVKGWKIQVGATDDPGKAAALLDKARARDRALLAAAKPLTEKVRKGEDTFYRARFAGLDSETADAACRSLKRSGFSCFATRD